MSVSVAMSASAWVKWSLPGLTRQSIGEIAVDRRMGARVEPGQARA